MNDLNSRYPFTCPCGEPSSLRPSLAMLGGLNTGHVTCPACAAFLHVELVDDVAVVEPWDAYLARTLVRSEP